MGKSKVTSAKFAKEFNSQNGVIYYHDIEFENGDKGQYGSKSKGQTKFIVGQEVEYELTPNGNYPPKIKPAQQPVFNGMKKSDPASDNFRQALIVAQSSITKVVELVIAEKVKMEDLQKVTDRLMQIQFDLAKKYQSEVNKPLEV